MSLSRILADLQSRDRRLDNIIQKIQRRTLILEEQNDPTSLIEPDHDFDFLSGGRVVNTCAINSLPTGGGGPNLGSGELEKDFSAGSQKIVLVKFAKLIFRIDGIFIKFDPTGSPKFEGGLGAGALYAGSIMTLTIEFITENYDPDTVTFGTKPATTSSIVETWKMISDENFILDNNGSGDIRKVMNVDGVGISFEKLITGPYFGMQISVDGDDGSLSNAKITGEVDIETLPEDDVDNPLGLSGNSTYAATIQ